MYNYNSGEADEVLGDRKNEQLRVQGNSLYAIYTRGHLHSNTYCVCLRVATGLKYVEGPLEEREGG